MPERNSSADEGFHLSMNQSGKTRTFAATAAATVLILSSVGCGGASATASVPKVGIGDNGPGLFANPSYRSLGTKIARKIIPYDFYHYAVDRQNLQNWMDQAQLAGVEPLISLNHSDHAPARLPTVGAYKKSVKYLLDKYPQIQVFSPWNEANHKSQPTVRNPKRAAQYYNASRQLCPNCQIVAADVLDQTNMLPWIKQFRTVAKNPTTWGLHSYTDVNHGVPWSRSASRKLLRAVPGEVWLTEVGGIVAFQNIYSYNERRAAQAVTRTLNLAQKEPRITRVYLYSWFGTQQKHRKPYVWDSGLANYLGKPRPAFFTLRKWLQEHPTAR
jgi:hypothetical protein